MNQVKKLDFHATSIFHAHLQNLVRGPDHYLAREKKFTDFGKKGKSDFFKDLKSCINWFDTYNTKEKCRQEIINQGLLKTERPRMVEELKIWLGINQVE